MRTVRCRSTRLPSPDGGRAVPGERSRNFKTSFLCTHIMLKIILNAPNIIMPFCEPARELRIQNLPLWLWQRNLLAPYVTRELELKAGMLMPAIHEPTIVYRE